MGPPFNLQEIEDFFFFSYTVSMKKISSSSLVIYQTPSGALELRGDFKKETLWATQAQMMEIFEIDQSVVSRHIKNIFSS